MTNLPNVTRFCGLPVDIVDGVVIACSNEATGNIEFEHDGTSYQIEVCDKFPEHLENVGLDKIL